MLHIKRNETRAAATPAEWLRLGAQLGEITNRWAGRGDIVAYVGPGAGGPAPACFAPATAEMEVNVSIAFAGATSPASIGDFTERSTHFEWPRAAGAVMHEAMHARFSRWDLASAYEALKGEPRVHAAMTLLEESRIEAFGVRYMPENREFLRACALDIVLADLKSDGLKESVDSAAQLVGLVLARVTAGVLEPTDFSETITDFINGVLGEDRVERLLDIAGRAQVHSGHADFEPLASLAREWVSVLDEARDERGETDEQPEGSGSTYGGSVGDIIDALEKSAEDAMVDITDALIDQEQRESAARAARERADSASERRSHEEKARKVFGAGTGPCDLSSTLSRLREKRAPRSAERAAAVQIARMLDRAKYRDRDVTRIADITPPGRMRARAMVQNAAARAQGRMAHAEPFRRNVRRHVDDPTLTVGIMVDISGSMSSAMEPMAVTAWVMAEAVNRVQGKAAMVYYGGSVFSGLKAGQRLDAVNVYTAPDMTEKFDDAFKAIDGELSLLHGTGPRLLVVVSDGIYTGGETNAARSWMDRCAKAGVAVLWLPFASNVYAAESIVRSSPSAEILNVAGSPTSAAMAIGQAAERVLTRAGAAR